MSILIGGSPSTGSSLLRRMLDRHTEVFCGSETSLFAKAELYQDWNKYKSRLFRPSHFGLSNAGWHNFIGINIEEEYGWERSELRQLIKSSKTNFRDFVDAFYKPILESTGKCHWAEKTPSNAFTLPLFLEQFPAGKVIHTVRHPLDTIASLVNRGMTVYNATAVCLLNMAKALELEEHPNYHLVRYESLVTDPETTLKSLCQFLDILYEPYMLEPQKEEPSVVKMDGWNASETAKASTVSIGRFEALPLPQRQLILRYAAHVEANNTNFCTLAELCEHLNYPWPDTDNIMAKEDIELDIKADIKQRQFSRFYFKAANYPISAKAHESA